MQIVFETTKDYVENIKINCFAGEWLVMNKALRQFANNEENHSLDRYIAETMLMLKTRTLRGVENEDTD